MKQQPARYKIIFNRRNKVLEKGEKAPVEIEVYFSRTERKIINTTINIEESQWGTSGRYKDLVKSNHPHYVEINQFLQQIIADYQKLEFSLINQNLPYNRKVLEDYIENNNREIDLIGFMERETDDDNAISKGTRKEFKYTINIFKEFHGEICQFSEFNYNLVSEFDRFLRKKGLKQNTIHKHHKNIQRFITIAVKRKYLQPLDNPYTEFTSKKIPGNRSNLTVEEIKRIEALHINNPGTEQLEYTRKLFLFAVYTGLRFTDVVGLTQDNIIRSQEGITIRIIQKKVENIRPVEVILPLYLLFEGKPQQILLEYMDESVNVFPIITNQVVNRNLKILAAMAQIQMVLTFHIARHTFGTFLADTTANPYLIMQLMGHSKIDTSMIYIHKSEERMRKQLRNIPWEQEWTYNEPSHIS